MDTDLTWLAEGRAGSLVSTVGEPAFTRAGAVGPASVFLAIGLAVGASAAIESGRLASGWGLAVGRTAWGPTKREPSTRHISRHMAPQTGISEVRGGAGKEKAR